MARATAVISVDEKRTIIAQAINQTRLTTGNTALSVSAVLQKTLSEQGYVGESGGTHLAVLGLQE